MALQKHNYTVGNVRSISDDMNPRIYWKEYRCNGCGVWVHQDDVVWAYDNGVLSMHGKPWCDSCVPEEMEDCIK